MYLKMFRAAEQAVNVLIAAQRECEELYLSDPPQDFKMLPLTPKNKKGMDEKMFMKEMMEQKAWMRSDPKSILSDPPSR